MTTFNNYLINNIPPKEISYVLLPEPNYSVKGREQKDTFNIDVVVYDICMTYTISHDVTDVLIQLKQYIDSRKERSILCCLNKDSITKQPLSISVTYSSSTRNENSICNFNYIMHDSIKLINEKIDAFNKTTIPEYITAYNNLLNLND